MKKQFFPIGISFDNKTETCKFKNKINKKWQK